MKNLKSLQLLLVTSCILLISWCTLYTKEKNSNSTTGQNSTEQATIEHNDTNQIKENEDGKSIIEQNKNIQSNEFIEYDNKKYGYRLKIPINRTFQEDNQWFDLILNSPKNDDINENLWIVVQELQIEESLESFTEKTIEWLKELYEDYNEIKKENIEINSNKWITLIYEITENWYKLKAQQTTFLINNKSYVFQYTATKDTFNNYINEITEIINSFTLLN